ncbi:arp2/3 complex-activating protein rickA-like [Mangifera indica]|uniref:arp2/3 complex-activating protein rickA-like n=1 Tax=Mangifera indica TaxID=29780 RepID=UPI001CF9B574|nr:arp2/3 complex-activating protein rickA-like [Mangifera indica]
MDTQRNPLLTFAYYCQGKSMEDLRHSLLCTIIELEQTKMVVQEELKKRDDQLLQLKDLLSKVIRERDAAQEKCQRLLFEKLLFQQQQQLQHQQQQTAGPLSGISSIEDDPRRRTDSNNGFSSSDCEESIVSSPVIDPIPPPQAQLQPPVSVQPQAPPPRQEPTIELVPEKPLPEKGNLLQAVMKAGPLLQTLLLAGPLPQWRHPPPPLESFEIPPVTIASPPPPLPQLHQDSLVSINACNNILNSCAKVNRKRVLNDGSDSPTETKYQRVLLP